MAYGLIQVDKVENSDGKSLNVGPSARVFDTVTDLQASTTLSDGDIAIVKERANAEYEIQSSAYTALEGDLTMTSGQVAELQLKPINDLRWWGDLSASNLQSALDRTQDETDAISSSSYVVSAHGLSVPIESTVSFNKGNVLSGGSYYASGSYWDTNTADVENDVVGNPMFKISGVKGCEFSDFHIDGGLVDNTLGAPALLINDSNNTTISRFVIVHHDYYGVWWRTKAGQSFMSEGVIAQWLFGEAGYSDETLQTAYNCHASASDVIFRGLISYNGLWQFSASDCYNTQFSQLHPWCAGDNTNGILIKEDAVNCILDDLYLDGIDVHSYADKVKIEADIRVNHGYVRLYANEADYTGRDIHVTIIGSIDESGTEQVIFEDGDYNWAYTKQCVINANGGTQSRPSFGRVIDGYVESAYEGATSDLFLINSKASYNTVTDRFSSGYHAIGINGSNVGFRCGFSNDDGASGTPVFGDKLGEFWATGANGTDFGNSTTQYIGGGGMRVIANQAWSSAYGTSLDFYGTAFGDTEPSRLLRAESSVFRSGSDNMTSLGSASYRWTQVYAANSTISTSDARLKTDLAELTDDEVNAAVAISKAMGYTWQWLENGDRTHTGPTVQLIMGIMEDNNLTPFDYSFICYDEWDEETEKVEVTPAVLDDDGNVVTEAVYEDQVVLEAGDRYSFRENELIKFCNAGLSARLDSQQETIDSILSRLDSLEG